MNESTDDLTAADLRTGDLLLRVGGVGFAQLRNPDSTPVIVAEVRPPLDDHHPDEAIVEILTSIGPLYARDNAPVLINRTNTVTDRTILLISRRRSLHARLIEFGVPVARRTPHTADPSAPSVTSAEWRTAPLIVIDAHLAASTLQAMWNRGDLGDRDQIIMVGTDPDEVRAEARQQIARARLFALLPYDKHDLSNLFHAAVQTGDTHDPFLGILTPHARP